MASGALIDMEQQPRTEQHSETPQSVALRAYLLWEERGCPWGTPEVDWFRAEQESRAACEFHHASIDEQAAPKPLAVMTAKIVGAVLGSVSGVVAAVSNSLTSD